MIDGNGHQPGTPPLLEINQLTIGFADARGILLAADRINLQLYPNQTLGLLGESGCGKSVTLRSILGLIPYPGEVIAGSIGWEGRNLLEASKPELQKIRGKEISMIFQDPTSSLNPVFTVENQIVETLRIKLKMSQRQARQRAVELLGHVGIPSPEQRLKLYPHQLSGGMRQRIMIAIAIASQPKLLLADEPTTALDVTIQDQILKLLADLRKEIDHPGIARRRGRRSEFGRHRSHVCGADYGERARSRCHSHSPASLHTRAAYCHPNPGGGERAEHAHADIRAASEPRQSAPRLSLPTALQVRPRRMRIDPC
jgi:ABC-type dipeptide/oligopeptide/nickel transport system ATPase subunit